MAASFGAAGGDYGDGRCISLDWFSHISATSNIKRGPHTNTTKVFPSSRNARAIGPGIEIRDSPEEVQRERDMDQLTSLE